MSIEGVLLLGFALVAMVFLVGIAIRNLWPASSARETVESHGHDGRRIKYRCEDGRTDYEFCFTPLEDSTWRVYILNQPGYGGRNDSLHATHRLIDDRGHYICWTDSLLTEEAARSVAKLWSECTQNYILTGERF